MRNRALSKAKKKVPLKKNPSATVTPPNVIANKKIINKFNSYYDDSSDEEEQESVHDINTAWQDFQNKSGEKAKKDLLSFVAHSTSIQFFRSPSVKTKYYEKKETLLKLEHPSATATLENLILEALTLSAKKTLKYFSIYLSLSPNAPNKKQQKKMFQQTKKDFSIVSHQFIQENLIQFIHWLKNNKFTPKHETSSDMIHLETAITQLFIEQCLANMPFKEEKNIREKTKLALASQAKGILNQFLKQEKIDNAKNTVGKEKALSACSEYKGPYQSLIHFTQQILKKASAQGCIKNILEKQLLKPLHQEKLILAYLKDLKANANELKNEERKLFLAYFSYDESSVIDSLTDKFSTSLHKKLLNALYSLKRPTLGQHCRLVSSGPHDFYAQSWLMNRSQKREILNLREVPFQQNTAIRILKLCGELPIGTDVIEKQEILKKSLGRRDTVEDLGNYKKVHAAILEIKTACKLKDDKDIAVWIRMIFQGIYPTLPVKKTNEQNFLYKLHAITYLLLGCEVSRNPAMLIINQMLLDLIINDTHWDFARAFLAEGTPWQEASCMPMAPEGAVAAARALENQYRPYMPFSYFYRGNIGEHPIGFSKQDLIHLEANIIEHWLTLKKISLPNNKSASFLQATIEASFDSWFGENSLKETQQFNRK